MTLYAFALFIHIVGSLLLCAAFTAEGIGLLQLRRAGTIAASADGKVSWASDASSAPRRLSRSWPQGCT